MLLYYWYTLDNAIHRRNNVCYSIIGIVKTMQYTLKKFSNSELFNYMWIFCIHILTNIQSYVVHICNFSSHMYDVTHETYENCKFELYKHNDELFNIYYGIFYEL